MPETRKDTNPDQHAAPGSVSNQNREEAEPGMLDDLHERSEDTGTAEDRGEGKDEGVGAAGEDSQASGHPNNAG